MSTAPKRIRVGTWIRMSIPDQGVFTGFTYVDAQAGFSAKGSLGDGTPHVPSVTVRLPLGLPWDELTAEEIAAQRLETPPGWVAEFYGPQPPAGMEWGWWQDHPKLQGRFHSGYPDDLQVVVHDGGPRLTTTPPELMWVRVIGGEGDVFTGQLLNQPHHLQSVRLGDTIRFMAAGGEFPIRVTEKYLTERSNWTITPCNKCGLGELFDAPSDLIRVVFPNIPTGENAQMEAFTTFCGVCRGVQLVKSHRAEGFETNESEGTKPSAHPIAKRSWWQFWK